MSKTSESKTFLVSDESKNSYGFMVLTSGIDTTAFESNPVMLFMHRRGKVFGSWTNLVKKDGKVYADPEFDLEDKDDEVQTVAGKVKRNVLKAASIGLEIQEVIYSDEFNCYVATKSVLEEISIVDIGSNRNAIRLYANGQPLDGDDLKNKLAELSAPSTPSSNLPPVQLMNFEKIAVALALAATSTEAQVLEAIVTLKTDQGYKGKYETLFASLAAERKTEADQLIEAAVNEKRITADLKETYQTLFAADHNAAKVLLAKQAKPVDLAQFATGATAQLAAPSQVEELKKLYDQHDKAGSMAKLKSDNPTEYIRLFEAKWGRKPSA